MPSLYELTENYTNVLEVLETAADEEVTELLQQTLQSVNEDIKTKVDNMVRVIRNYEADVKALKDEEKRLADKRKSVENSKQRLENYLQSFTSETEGKKFKGNIFDVSIRKNPPKVIVDDESLIPVEFITVKEVKTVDKTALKNHIKLIGDVEGCRLVQEESLKIK